MDYFSCRLRMSSSLPNTLYLRVLNSALCMDIKEDRQDEYIIFIFIIVVFFEFDGILSPTIFHQ